MYYVFTSVSVIFSFCCSHSDSDYWIRGHNSLCSLLKSRGHAHREVLFGFFFVVGWLWIFLSMPPDNNFSFFQSLKVFFFYENYSVEFTILCCFLSLSIQLVLSGFLNHGCIGFTEKFLVTMCLLFSQLSYYKPCNGTVFHLPEEMPAHY